MRADRRTLLTGGALVLVLAAGAWTWFGPSGGTGAPAARAGARTAPTANQAALPPAETMAVRLSALEAARVEPSDMTRNPFTFEARRAAPMPAVDLAGGNAPALAPAPATPPGPPPLPPITLKFIGVVEKADGMKLAVLTDGRGPLHGKEGDIIDGRYRIVRIGTESIDMAYADGRGQQTIRMTGR